MSTFGSLEAGIVGVAVGEAGAAAIEPVLEPQRQEAWKASKAKILDLGTLARLVAQGLVDLDHVVDEAARNGYTQRRLEEAVQLELAAAPVAELLELWRRDKISESLVDHGLAKAQIEVAYWPAIKELFYARLDPALIAVMVQRSILPNAVDPVTGQEILPGQPSTSGSNVPPMPQVDIDPITEAKAHGIDFPRLAAEARIVGLPASADLAARMHFRKIITEGAFNQAILEGNTRGEWAPFLLDGFRQILTAGEYAELQLRGYLTRDQRLLATDKHGMSTEDSDLLYDVLGRSIPVHQIVTGLARGGVFDGPIDAIPKVYLEAMERGNLRPEYYNLAYANRYSYESVFVMRALVEAGDLTVQEAHDDLLAIGWRPDRAASVSAAWGAKVTATKSNPWLAKAEQQWWTAAHKAFVKNGTPRTIIEPIMLVFVTDLADRDAIFQWWTDERAVDAGALP
jgi:hypothetical protein